MSTEGGGGGVAPHGYNASATGIVFTGATFLLLIGAALTATSYVQNTRNELIELRDQLDALTTAVAVAAASSTTAADVSVSPSRQNKNIGRELTSSCACPVTSTYVTDYGAIGDGQTDDTQSIQSAIYAASNGTSSGGGTVLFGKGVFRTSSPLLIPGGVTLKGEGYGSSPLAIQFDAGSSTIAYCGYDYAVKIQGHGVSIRDMAIYDYPYDTNIYGLDCTTTQAEGGVLVDGNNDHVESVSMSNVLLYYFMGGTALTLQATNYHGIAYGSYDNIRIRHAKQGIHLTADSTSFVNSNTFMKGAISGTINDVAVLAEGPGPCNDNKFYGMVIEPALTSITHVWVKGPKTNVKMHDVRLEGTDMFAIQRPLVIIEDDSYGNVMDGMIGHTHVQADLNRNPDINFVGAKTVGLDPAPHNLFWNAAFHNLDVNTLPGWSLPGTNRIITVLDESEEIYPYHRVLNVDYLNYGGPFKLTPSTIPKATAHSQVTFGIYARSSVANSIEAAMRYESGSIISSTSHSGSGDWEFIGMSALYDKSAPYFYFSITGDVDVTAPTFVYGSTPATPGASLLSSAGAQMSGTLSLSMSKLKQPDPSTPYYWILPREGNVFEVDTTGSTNMHRLNYSTANRLPKGTVVTLLFGVNGIGFTVKHSGYINLKGNVNFVVTKLHSSLTLVSTGITWTEVSRND